MSELGIVLASSGAFGVPTLERLASLHDSDAPYRLLEVVTRPDSRAGRGQRVTPTPVRRRAVELGLEPIAPESANDEAFLDRIAAIEPDIFIVADYGEFLGKRFRSTPRLGAFNLHSSLLPRHRGAAPVVHALLAGDRVTGVTLFRIVREMDAGPIVDTVEVPIEPDENAGEIEARLAVHAADLLERNLPRFLDGTFEERPQDDSLATRAPKLLKKQGRIDWRRDAGAVVDHIRAMTPWPGAVALHRRVKRGGGDRDKAREERLLILRARVDADGDESDGDDDAAPGLVVVARGSDLIIACGRGRVRIDELQRSGKSPVATDAFLRGYPLRAGDRLETPAE